MRNEGTLLAHRRQRFTFSNQASGDKKLALSFGLVCHIAGKGLHFREASKRVRIEFEDVI